jgi:multiple sugar transport system permease protein
MNAKRQRPRVWRAVLAAALAALCAASVRAGDGDPRRRVVLWNLFTAGDQHKVITELVARFNRTSAEYRVEKVDIPYQHIHAKMLPAVAGGTPPDVSIFDRFLVASYAARGAFVSLDERVAAAGLHREDFFDAPWDECIYDRKQFAVPYDTDVRVMYYNRGLFREAGLDPDKPPRTWSELRACSDKLTKRRPNGQLDQVGFVPLWGNTTLYLYGWQKGGHFMSADGRRVTLNDPKIVDALAWVSDFVHAYGVENLMNLQSGFGAEGQNPFITGRIAMEILDVGELSMMQKYGADLDWAAAPCPYADDGRPATWSGGFSMVIPRGARCPDGAWALCRFILSEDSQRFMGTASNKLPAGRSAANDPFYQTSAFWRLAIDQMKYSHYRPVTPVGQAIITELNLAVDQVVHDKLAPAQALDAATRESQKELDRFMAEASGTPVDWTVVVLLLGGGLGFLVAVRAGISYRRVRSSRLHRRQAVAGYLFAAPAILGLAVFMAGPVLASLVYSFARYEILTPGTWVGVENYGRLFTEDRFFLTALWNTFYFAAVSVPVNVALALGLALLLNRQIAGRSFYRTFFYLPSVVPVVAGSLLWAWLFNGEYGLVNVVLGYLGLPSVPWLTNEYWSKPALIIMGLWNVGGGMIIFLAALQGVPRTLYEAAEIDGAGAWTEFWRVTLPMISPALFFMVVMGVIGSLQVFTQAYLMTSGGPVNSTLFYVLYLFREAFENLHMGYASAMAWVLFMFILLLTGLQFLLAKRWVYYEGVQR